MKTSGNVSFSILLQRSLLLFAITLLLASYGKAKTIPMYNNRVAVVAIGADGKVTLTANMLVNNRLVKNIRDVEIQILDGAGRSYGRELSAINVGQKLTYLITEDNGNVQIAGELVVVDVVPPVMKCTDYYITDLADYSPRKIGYPTVSDNVSNLDNRDLEFTDTYYDLDCFTELDNVAITGMIERKWTAVDDSNNKATGIQTIYIKKQSLLDVVFPEDVEGISSCNLDDVNRIGVPRIDGKQLVNCEISKIAVSYTDEVTNLNGDKKLILRKWTVQDICTDEQIEKVQVIRVEENELPALEIPEHLSFSTNATDNYAVVILPRPKFVANCIDPIVTVSWEYGNGFGPYEKIPVGMYKVDYRIANRNGFQKEYSTVVVVEDNEKPSIIGKIKTDISTQRGQSVVVFANSLDDGSFDNCGIDYFEVSLDGETFYDSIEIATEAGDKKAEVEVILRGYDVNGLYSDAKTKVIVHNQ